MIMNSDYNPRRSHLKSMKLMSIFRLTMAISKSKLKVCSTCGAVWDNAVYHPKCPNGHMGIPRDIDWDN